MTARRTAVAAALTAVALVTLLGSWLASGWARVRASQLEAREAPRRAAAELARARAAAVDARLAALARREDERPWYHYRILFHDPRGAADGNAVAPSPLSGGPDDPLVAAHFQIAADGAVTLPTLDEAVPELGAADLAAARATRDAIAAAAPALRAEPGAPGAAIALAGSPGRIEVLDQHAYVQNVQSVEVYQQARQGKRAPVAAGDPGGDVAITVAPLAWHTVDVAGEPALAAVRRVETPDGTLTQGLLIRRDALAALAADGRATIVVRPTDAAWGTAAAPLAAVGGAWSVVVDDYDAIMTARARAGALELAFLGRFVPVSLLALACGAMVVLIVARAERAARERARFAAAAAHELRTPLAGLQLYGDMLADGLGHPARARDYARRVAEEAARLGRVVSNVLDFSRLERGNLSVAAAPGDAAAAARDAVERARPALERAGATVEVEVDAGPGGALPARFDADALARILGNLLDNAEKYGRGGADRTVTVRARAAGDRVEIAVADRGPGIAPAAARALFRPFARGVDTDGPPGLGLGLALSRSLARAMGGDLVHRAGPGGGAVFVVTLPGAGAA